MKPTWYVVLLFFFFQADFFNCLGSQRWQLTSPDNKQKQISPVGFVVRLRGRGARRGGRLAAGAPVAAHVGDAHARDRRAQGPRPPRPGRRQGNADWPSVCLFSLYVFPSVRVLRYAAQGCVSCLRVLRCVLALRRVVRRDDPARSSPCDEFLGEEQNMMIKIVSLYSKPFDLRHAPACRGLKRNRNPSSLLISFLPPSILMCMYFFTATACLCVKSGHLSHPCASMHQTNKTAPKKIS